jgi:hypothetical protein
MKQTITLGLAAAMVSWFAQPGYAENRGGGGGHFSGGGGGAHVSNGGMAHFAAPSVRSAPSFHAPSVSHFSTVPHYSYRTYGSPRSSTTFAPSISNQSRVFMQPRQSGPTMAFGGNSVTSRTGRADPRTFAAPAGVSRGWDRGHMHNWNHHHYRFFNGNWFIVDGGFYGPYGYGYADVYPYSYDYGYDQPYYGYGDTYAGPAPAIALSQNLVAAVQNQLTRLGYVTGVSDGVFGPMTQNALANFQRDHNLSVTGQLDQMTLQALGVPYD